MNIIWKRPDGGISVTHLTDEGLEAMLSNALRDGIITETEAPAIDAACRAHAGQLRARGDIPADWIMEAVNITLPESREWREAWTWATSDPVIDICPVKAVDVTKNRLRAERRSILAELDVVHMRAVETGMDTSGIVTEKQRLRDITKLVEQVAPGDLDALKALSCSSR